MNAVNRALKYALPSIYAGLLPVASKCSSASCHPRSKFRPFSFRPEGTSIDHDWYCGPDCFEEAARNCLAALCSKRQGQGPRRPRMPLGLTALSLGHIVSEELQMALSYQRQNGGRIGEILIDLGFATQAQITAALAAQWGYPVLSLQNRQLHVSQRIPARLMELYTMLPIHFVHQTNKLVIGFAEYVEHRILTTIEAILGCSVLPCFITRDEFDSHFQSIRVQPENQEVIFEQPAGIQEIARIIRSYACQIGASSTNFGICGDYVWCRLQNSRAALDILSRV